jgi:hypothetical protein
VPSATEWAPSRRASASDPLDETTADASVTERRDHADDAQRHRAVVIAEPERTTDHISLDGGHDHERLVGSETLDEVVDAVVTAVDRLGQLRTGQVERGPQVAEVAHGMHLDRRGAPRPLRTNTKTGADLGQRLMSAQSLRSQQTLPAVHSIGRRLGKELADVGQPDAGSSQEAHGVGLLDLGELVVPVSRGRIDERRYEYARLCVGPQHLG